MELKVLVVDHKPDQAYTYIQRIEHLGHMAKRALNSQTALKMLEEEGGFSLVIANEWLGGDSNMSGTELLVHLRGNQKFKDLRFILVELECYELKGLKEFCAQNKAEFFPKLHFIFDRIEEIIGLNHEQFKLDL